jgi:hypothetical protein
MNGLSTYQLWYGRDEPPAPVRHLRAGPLTAVLEGCDLRYVRLNGQEIVRRLYVAVRDHDWDTIPGALDGLTVEEDGASFTIRFAVRHRRGAIDFAWAGEITGAASGALTYAMDGRASSAFRYNRIGLCVLHPMEHAGCPYTAATPAGPLAGRLPERIGPQLIVDGQIRALFPAFDELTIAPAGGGRLRFAFEGDLFEMEDQRNWTDASFKTYSTPLALPWPHDAQPGQVIRQRVTISADGLAPAARPATGPARLTLGAGLGRRLPPVGLGMASHGRPLAPAEAAHLRALRPAHLRVDLRLGEPAFSDALARARAAAAALGCPLELALFLTGDAAAELARLADLLPGVPVARVLVFHAVASARAATAVAGGPLVEQARAALGAVTGSAPFAGGTDFYFTELNRWPPDPARLDAVAYSINPQVHAFDETSLVETLLAQGETVRSAQQLAGNRPVIVSPITLKPRANPNATDPAGAGGAGGLPDAVDPRQLSLFGAVWTAGSLKALAEAGAAALTYYETTGWRGVLESAAGSPRPDLFPSWPGMIFPLYHVLADAGEWAGGELVAATSSEPLTATALAVRTATGLHLLVANLTPAEQPVVVGPLPGQSGRLRRLTAATAALAMTAPERFRAAASGVALAGADLAVSLAPYELLRVDLPARA